jgi:hypothetical protein
MFFSNYYKVTSDNGIFGEIYVMDNPTVGTHIEIFVFDMPKKGKYERVYKITDTLINFAQPFLFTNLFFKDGIENYIKISKDEFLSIYDKAFNQHRNNCL